MKKNIDQLRKKSIKELTSDSESLRQEIIKLKMSEKSNPTKDSNLLTKKRKILARTLTIISEKSEKQKIDKLKS